MAYSRLLLLLIGVISSHLPEVQAKPATFWCSPKHRDSMRTRIEAEIEAEMAGCVGSDTLPSPVQLPFVGVHLAEWANKTLQQKRAEVVGDVRMFQDAVQQARNQTTSQCQTSLLGRLEHKIKNVLIIINKHQKQNDTVTPAQSEEKIFSSSSSLRMVLKNFISLLTGKLERFAIDLVDTDCPLEQRTAVRRHSD